MPGPSRRWVTLLIGGMVADCLLIMFAWPQFAEDQAVALKVDAGLVWLSRHNTDPLLLVLVQARVNAAAAERWAPSIFWM
jgi:hypothetical protein